MALKTRKRFKPDEIAVAIEAFTTAGNRVVHDGDRLRGDDELVRKHPHLFVADGSTSEEVGAARSALLPDYTDPKDPTGPKVAGPIPLDRRLVAMRDAAFRLPDGSMWIVRTGDIYDGKDERVVRARKTERDLFKKARA